MKLNQLAVAVFSFAITTPLYAQIFNATGVGETQDEARKIAVTNAIKSSIGEFVLAKEELNNEDYSEKIISYSNAYVKKVDVLEQQKNSEGDYEVKVAVDIESQKLLTTLKEMNIAVAENVVDNQMINAVLNNETKNNINKETEKNFEDLFYELLIKPLEENKNLLHVNIDGKLKPIESKNDSDSYLFELPLSLEVDPAYISAFKKLLSEGTEPTGKIKVKYINVEKNKLIEKYINRVSPKYRELFLDLNRTMSRISRNYVVNAILLDKDNEEMKVLEFSEEYFNLNYNMVNGRLRYSGTDNKVLKEASHFNIPYLPSISINTDPYADPYNNYDFISILSGKIKRSIYFSLTKDEVMQLKDIKVEVKN